MTAEDLAARAREAEPECRSTTGRVTAIRGTRCKPPSVLKCEREESRVTVSVTTLGVKSDPEPSAELR